MVRVRSKTKHCAEKIFATLTIGQAFISRFKKAIAARELCNLRLIESRAIDCARMREAPWSFTELSRSGSRRGKIPAVRAAASRSASRLWDRACGGGAAVWGIHMCQLQVQGIPAGRTDASCSSIREAAPVSCPGYRAGYTASVVTSLLLNGVFAALGLE